MTYYADLETHKFFDGDTDFVPGLSIGWLDRLHLFPTGEVPQDFVTCLYELSFQATALTCGHHVCNLSGCTRRSGEGQIIIERDGRTLFLGNGEIHVPGRRGALYSAPTLVYHYVVDHRYKPPQPFIDAVLEQGRLYPCMLHRKEGGWFGAVEPPKRWWEFWR